MKCIFKDHNMYGEFQQFLNMYVPDIYWDSWDRGGRILRQWERQNKCSLVGTVGTIISTAKHPTRPQDGTLVYVVSDRTHRGYIININDVEIIEDSVDISDLYK